MTHTNGPWEVETEDLKNGIVAEIHSYAAERWIADVAPQGESPDGEAISNAHLIAAAPELLAALESVRDYCQSWIDGTHPHAGDALTAAEIRDMARAAIAKAEGGAA